MAAPSPRSALDAMVTLTTAAVVAALSLSLLVLMPLLLDLALPVDSAVQASMAAVLALLPAGYVAAHLGFRRAAPPVVPGEAAALRASVEVLVASAWVSLVNLLVLGGVLVTASAEAEAMTTLQTSCVLTVFVGFTAGLLLMLLSVSRPIPETVSRRSIQAVKVAGMMFMTVNVSVSVALVCFA